MSPATRKLTIQIVWFDADMLELSLSAASEGFAGRSNFYAGQDAPMELANRLEGFPLSVDDVRQYEFGLADFRGDGSASIQLSCLDGLGHLSLRIGISMNSPAESATVVLNVSPVEIDSFVEQLRRMAVQVGQMAVLGDAH